MTALRVAGAPKPGRTAKPSPRPQPGASGRPVTVTDAGGPDHADPTLSTPVADEPSAATDAARLRRLIEAQAVINSDLSLSDMLGRIVRTACELVGARYGALGVIGHDGTLEQLVHYGLDDSTISAIGRLPIGRHGLLGAMIDDPSPVRVDDIAADPRAVGFPPNHPPMHTFLGVPIRVRGEVFGDIYLAEAEGGAFSAADEELVSALASTAGTAIANARLLQDAQRSRDWLHASGEVTRALLAEADVDTLLDIVSRALQVAEADYGALILPDESGELLSVPVAVGIGAEHYIGVTFERTGDSPMGRLINEGRSSLINDLDTALEGTHENPFGFGPGIVAALVDAKGPRGAVLLMRSRGRAPFTDSELQLASSFADQIALALEMNDARNAAEWLRVLEVRHQIAQDLHDNVIQRLFATGMGLHSIVDSLPAGTAGRLSRYVGELDETIDEIRERVFGLREDSRRTSRVRGRFSRLGRAG